MNSMKRRLFLNIYLELTNYQESKYGKLSSIYD